MDSPAFRRDSCQQYSEPRHRRSRLRASLSVSSTLRKIATDVDSPPVAPEPVDLRITQGLLSESTLVASSKGATAHQGDIFTSGLCRDRRTSVASIQTGEPQGHSRITSTTWSTVSNRVFTNSSRSSERDALEFIAEYNRLGGKHGLPRLCHDVKSAVTARATLPSNQPPVSWLFRKLLRKAPSAQTMRHSSNPRLTHNSSVGDIALIDRGRKDILKGKTLEDIARLGGESVFLLPVGSAPGPLVIPSCFSATGTYILQHGETKISACIAVAEYSLGIKTRGIFRVSGSLTATNALYDHYSRQFQEAEKSVQLVHRTVSSGQIPLHIPCNIHDVASVFKKFLIGLPGGILGSVPLFKALRDIHTTLFPSPDLPESHQRKVEARLIALAVAGLVSEHSLALICAVFGLLNLVGYEAENSRTTDEEGRTQSAKDMMSYEALGVVFGPLLLGNKMELVELHAEDDRGGLLVIPESPTGRRGGRRKKNVVKATYNNINAQVGEAKMAAGVTEMLVRNWKEVVRQLRNIGAVDSTQLTEAPVEDAAGKDASATAVEASGNPLHERGSNDLRGEAEIAENWVRRKSQTHSIGDMAAIDRRTLPNSDARSIPPPSLARIRTTLDSNNNNPLSPAILDDLNSIEVSDSLPLVRSPSSQLQHPLVSEAKQEPAIAAGSRAISVHDVGLARETAQAEKTDPGKSFSILVGQNTAEIALPGNSAVEAIGRDDRDYPLQSVDSYCQDTSATNWRMFTDRTELGKGEEGQKISLLTVASESGFLAEGKCPRTRDTAEDQELQDPDGLEDTQLITSHRAPSRETSPYPGMDVGNKLPPQLASPDDVLLCVELDAHTRYSMPNNQFQGNVDSNPHSAESDVLQASEWLSDMNKVALGGGPAPTLIHKMQQLRLGDGPQSSAKASTRDMDSTLSGTLGKQPVSLALEASYNIETVETIGATPPSSVKSRNSPQSFDILKDQDVPTRSSSMAQAMVKCPLSANATPIRHRSETPIRKPGTASADRLDRLLPPVEEPEVARHINWRNSSELGTSRTSSEQGLTPKLSLKGNATLYAEIRRLQRVIDLRTEEAIQAQRELEAMRKFKDSGTLSEKLREAQRDLKTWKNRAEWAEKRLLMQDAERRATAPTRKKDGDVAPIRGGRRTTGLERATMM